MEQKRTLWIVAAVGVFLLVVLGAALILYTPAARPTGTIADSRGMNNGTASNGWISLAPSSATQTNNIGENSENQNSYNFEENSAQSNGAEFRADEVNVYADKANVYSEKTDLSGLGNNANVTGTQNSIPQQTVINNTTTIDLTEPAKPVVVQNGKNIEAEKILNKNQTASVKTKNSGTAQNEIKSVSSASTGKVVQKNVSTSNKNVKPAATANKSNIAKKLTASTESPKETKYWVQVTALTSRKSADQAREKLGENEINADVFTYTDSKNRLFYRVRVGPYTTKSEAEYWRNKISKIDTFQNTSSYVTSTTVEN